MFAGTAITKTCGSSTIGIGFSQFRRLKVQDQKVEMFGFPWYLLLWLVDIFLLTVLLYGHFSLHAHSSSLSSYKDNSPVDSSNFQFSSIQFSRSVVSDSLRPHESQHARPPCPSPTPGVHSDSRPSSEWCHPAISSSVVPFSSCPQALPPSESFPMNQLFTWGGQSTGVSALASFLPKKSQGWSPSEWTGCISLQSKGLSRVFSNITVQKCQFFSAQPSQSSSHIHTWLLEKP